MVLEALPKLPHAMAIGHPAIPSFFLVEILSQPKAKVISAST